MRRILVPFDGSKAAERALDVAVDLALQHDASISLLHVLLHDAEADPLLNLPGISAAGEAVVDELKRLAQAPEPTRTVEEQMANPGAPVRPAPAILLRIIGAQVLGWAKSHVEEQGARARSLNLVDGRAAESILATASEIGADAIVMGTRGLRPMEAITVGSVSQEVCRTSKCSCIMVH